MAKKFRPFTGPGRISGGPNVVNRVIDLVYRAQGEGKTHEVSVKQVRRLARYYDPVLTQKPNRIHWGLHFLVDLGHLRRVKPGVYRIIE